MKKTGNKKRVYLSIFLFFFIFMPPLFPKINILYVVDVFAAVALRYKYRTEVRILKHKKDIKTFIVSYWIFTIVTTVRMMLDYLFVNQLEMIEYIINTYRLVGVGLFIHIGALYVVSYCIHNGFNFRDLAVCIVNSGLIEGCFTILMVLSPQIKIFFLNIFVNNVYGSWEAANIPSWMLHERLFGFANVLFDGFGYGTGIIAGIAYFLMYENKVTPKKILHFLILLIVPTVNAITGLMIAISAIIIKTIQAFRKHSIQKSFLMYVPFILSIGILGIYLLNDKASYAMLRLQENIQAMLGKNSNITSYGNLMRSSYWTMPDDIFSKLFGTGHTVYTTKHFIHSDTGYTNMLWLAGVFGCIWLYGTFVFALYKKIHYSKSGFTRTVLLFLIAAFLIFEIKGIGVAINTGMPIIITLMYMACMEQDGQLLSFKYIKNSGWR